MIRAIACLSVVFLHSVKINYGYTVDYSNYLNVTINYIAGMLAAGTATFVFISEVLLSHSYPDQLREGFLKKRLMFIGVPFLIMAIFYAVYPNLGAPSILIKQLILNVFAGGYHGWFVLVVFQFFLLHWLYIKFLKKIPMKLVMSTAFFLNLIYLLFFNLTDPINNSTIVTYLWDRGYWIFFPGWLFLFSLAYYCGKDYEVFLKKIDLHKRWIFTGLFLSTLLILTNNFLFNYGLGSKRWDMLFFSTFAILTLFIVLKNKKTPRILRVVSDCSFGIYLIHYFYILSFDNIFKYLGFTNNFITIPSLFLLTVIVSIATVYILNLLPFGKYIVGKVNVTGIGIPKKYVAS